MTRSAGMKLHHLGVQTADLNNCLEWYLEFFGAEKRWELDQFSELTLSRLSGIRRLVEISAGDVRIHLFDRAGHSQTQPEPNGFAFQHACVSVSSPEELADMRRKWIELYDSGRFSFASAEQPTKIVVDDDGVQSLYVLDVNGLEYEISYVPDGDR
jgi:catechol 2,3-dioxygenase-like lactoylglutathione lyase family enzyme